MVDTGTPGGVRTVWYYAVLGRNLSITPNNYSTQHCRTWTHYLRGVLFHFIFGLPSFIFSGVSCGERRAMYDTSSLSFVLDGKREGYIAGSLVSRVRCYRRM